MTSSATAPNVDLCAKYPYIVEAMVQTVANFLNTNWQVENIYNDKYILRKLDSSGQATSQTTKLFFEPANDNKDQWAEALNVTDRELTPRIIVEIAQARVDGSCDIISVPIPPVPGGVDPIYEVTIDIEYNREIPSWVVGKMGASLPYLGWELVQEPVVRDGQIVFQIREVGSATLIVVISIIAGVLALAGIILGVIKWKTLDVQGQIAEAQSTAAEAVADIVNSDLPPELKEELVQKMTEVAEDAGQIPPGTGNGGSGTTAALSGAAIGIGVGVLALALSRR